MAQQPERRQYVFLAGALSGLIEGIVVQPLELLKTRAQIHEGQPLAIAHSVQELLREGGVRQLYRGGLPEIVGLVPRATAALSTLEFSRRWFRQFNGGQLPTSCAYLAGALSGVSEGIAFAPFQVIKVRLMAKEHLGRYRNSWDCLRKVLASEGPQALLIGLAPTLIRNSVWNCVFYGTMHVLEQKLTPLESGWAEAGRQLVLGTGVGIAATTLNTPFDVVKSRFQSQLPGERRYRRVLPTLATIAREEGALALYKGFLPKALRLGLGQTIGLLVFQRLLAFLGVSEADAQPQAAVAGSLAARADLPLDEATASGG